MKSFFCLSNEITWPWGQGSFDFKVGHSYHLILKLGILISESFCAEFNAYSFGLRADKRFHFVTWHHVTIWLQTFLIWQVSFSQNKSPLCQFSRLIVLSNWRYVFILSHDISWHHVTVWSSKEIFLNKFSLRLAKNNIEKSMKVRMNHCRCKHGLDNNRIIN